MKYQLSSFFKSAFIILGLCFSFSVNAQLSKTHYVPPLTNAIVGNANPNEQYIYISTPSIAPINYTIKPVGQGISGYISGTVSNQAPAEIPIDTDYGQLFVQADQTSTVMNDKGYIIEADSPIYVSVRMLAGDNGRPQAGALVSKGLAALGTTFRAGMYNNENPQDNYLNFISVMATEDNTVVNFSDIPAGVVIENYTGSTPVSRTLNKGESYILATTCTSYVNFGSDPAFDNRAGLIGALVTSDKPIVMNCGSANGSFFNGSGRDYGIDQIVGLSKVGSEYIFIKGGGENGWENVLIVAHSNNTNISINGNAPVVTINAGEFYIIEGNSFSASGNMYVQTSEPVFAYQGIGATTSEANQGLFFVPPLSCETKGNIDNIPFIDSIGTAYFPGGITIVTKSGANLVVKQNGVVVTNNIQGPFSVTGKPDYVTYKVLGIDSNVSVECDEELYCAYFNSNAAATSGSFYSGFPSPPEINFNPDFNALGICLGNITLQVANPGSFDSFEWYYDDGTGYIATGNTSLLFEPTAIGNYKLIGVLDCTGTTLESYEIPVGLCPDDVDGDGIPDNIDIDNDNDGILNCTESNGDQNIDLTNPLSGNIPVGSYSFSGTVTDQDGNPSTSISGTTDGTFQSDVPVKTTATPTSTTYNLSFDKPLNLLLNYASSNALGNSELNADEEFIIRVPNTRTITLLDPDDQLLIDTNYDGVYESGVTMVSAFEIRFKRNGAPLPLGSGTFGFYANNVDAITYIHTNTSEIESKQASFQIITTCVAKDSDGDGIQDALDLDSDNDAIPDFLELTGTLLIASGVDTNQDGLDDVFDVNAVAVDSDNDGVPDVYDLDSDNDGIFDWVESGAFNLVQDSNNDGMVDGPFGINGWVDAAESASDSNQLGYQPNDADNDTFYTYRDLDSDGDGCSDVIEADFTDGNGDNYLGDNPPTVNTQGLVNNASDGYINPNPDYLISAPLTIDVQPSNIAVCEGSDNNISLVSSSYDTIQWEVSSDGVNWTTITDDAIYSDSQTNSLLITNAPLTFNNNNYRAFLNRAGNGCGLYSDAIVLTVNALPNLNSPIELIQCDDDDLNTLGFSYFNLTEANEKILPNTTDETFTYYTSEAAAISGDQMGPDFISNPTTFENRTVSNDVVWVRVESIYNCSSTAELQLKVSSTSIPSSFLISYNECDDFLDVYGNDTAENNNRDGISTFDFSAADATIRNLIPAGQNPAPPRYYRNEADALAEENEITDITNYRNIGYPNSQFIYVRIDSELSNDCLGLGPHILLTVEPLPVANLVSISRQCDDDFDGQFPFDTSAIESTILGTQDPTEVSVSYTDQSGNPLPSPLPNPFLTGTQTINIRVTNNMTSDPDGPCYDETSLDFIVDEKPVANPFASIIVCDGDAGDIDNDGRYPFDTSSIGSTVLGNQTNMEIYYSFIDENGQQINQATNLPNPLQSGTQSIQVDVINPINTACIATTFVDLVVNPLPEFSVESPRIVCTSDPTFRISLDPIEANASESFDYAWYFEGNLLSTNPTLDNVSIPGTYTVTLTKTDGTDCSRTRNIDVQASELAKTTIEDITIVDISENNTVTINTDNIGRGQYEFALQEENTPYLNFQSEPVFNYVRGGFYTLIIRDAICGSVAIPISVVAHPKYFTPNGDGMNDLWQIRGINSNVQPNSVISIYDRYGKLLKQLLATSPGWDGTFKGHPMPADDYWFSVQLQDGRHFSGHFALKR